MFLKISTDITSLYPNLRVGYVLAQNIRNEGSLPERLIHKSNELENNIRQKFPDISMLGNNTLIELWRNIYKDMGSKPNKHLPTVEALVRRIMKGGRLPEINIAVNAYLIAELETLIPVGGYDMSSLNGDIVLRLANDKETFIGMDGIEDFTYRGELIYSDYENVLTRRWNYRDCNKTQITDRSQNIVLFAEAPTLDVSTELLEETLNSIVNSLQTYCDADCKSGIADCESGTISFEL